MPEPPLIKAEDTTTDAAVTALIAHHTTDIVMAAGITDMTMCTAVSSVAIEAAAVWIEEQQCLEERKRNSNRQN